MTGTAEGSSSSTKAMPPPVLRHHQAVAGFLLGFFLVLLLYTTVFSQLGPRAAIGVLQSSTPAVRADQNAGNPPTSPTNVTKGNYMKQDNLQKTNDKANKVEEERIQPQNDVQSNHTEAKLGDGGVNVASDRMEEELIRQELDHDASKNDTRAEHEARRRKPLCDLSDPRYDICEVSGDARAIGANRTVLYIPPAGSPAVGDTQEWSIRDQSRKYLENINNVTVKSLSGEAAPCRYFARILATTFLPHNHRRSSERNNMGLAVAKEMAMAQAAVCGGARDDEACRDEGVGGGGGSVRVRVMAGAVELMMHAGWR